MTSGVVFGLSVLMNFVACGIVTKLCIWPRLRVMSREEALLPLVAPHMFRFVGLSFLVPGVVSTSLSPDFARPAAYGDVAAALLAIITVLALAARAFWALLIVWILNPIQNGGNPGILPSILWFCCKLLYRVSAGCNTVQSALYSKTTA